MHDEVGTFVTKALDQLPKIYSILEFGCRDVNGSVMSTILHKLGDNLDIYFGIDLLEGPNVTRVADAATFKPDFEPDLVVCTSVLEHTFFAPEIVANAARVLRPGGSLLLTTVTDPCPPHSGVDGHIFTNEERAHPSEYYKNVNPLDLAVLFNTVFEQWAIEKDVMGNLFALATKSYTGVKPCNSPQYQDSHDWFDVTIISSWGTPAKPSRHSIHTCRRCLNIHPADQSYHSKWLEFAKRATLVRNPIVTLYMES